LRRTLNRRIGPTGLPVSLVARLWTSAALAAAGAWGVKLAVGDSRPIVFGGIVLCTYAAIYFSATYLLGVEECAGAIRRLARRR